MLREDGETAAEVVDLEIAEAEELLLQAVERDGNEDDEGEFDETIVDTSEIDYATFFLINLQDGIEAYCPYLQDIVNDDWILLDE